MADSSSDTGWKPIVVDSGDGEASAKGHIELAKAYQFKPCMGCKSWEKDERRLIQHMLARGHKPQPDGTFISPIAIDMKDKTPLRVNPKTFGFCRREGSVTDMLASCEKWEATLLIEDMRRKLRRG